MEGFEAKKNHKKLSLTGVGGLALDTRLEPSAGTDCLCVLSLIGKKLIWFEVYYALIV
jgi:hypothetical protein